MEILHVGAAAKKPISKMWQMLQCKNKIRMISPRKLSQKRKTEANHGYCLLRKLISSQHVKILMYIYVSVCYMYTYIYIY